MNRLSRLFILLALPWLALTTGCFDAGSDTPPADTFVFASSSEHHTLDPQRMSWLHDIRIADALYETLVRTDLETMAPEPAAARRWTVSEDRRTWTFHLQPDGKFDNGDPVTADSFRVAWRRALMPDTASPYAHLLYVIDGAESFYQWRQAQIAQVAAKELDAQAALDAAREKFDQTVAIKALDDHTLEVTLARPVPYFLELCGFATFAPIHVPSWKAQTQLNPDTGTVTTRPDYFSDPAKLVSNGPYQLADRQAGEHLTLSANPHWWNQDNLGVPHIREVVISEPNNARLRYGRGSVHWLPDLPSASALAAEL
ncbi:MAG: ABC transporter substrate-binding protein, partial [Phycisphaeraceae bacterium]|nr:ABC transporter substrate-binding protein [Phycisphaeraceae bacterium]